VREIAFTHLNRFCAYKMMEARESTSAAKFREAVSRGINSNGVKFYLADHPDEDDCLTLAIRMSRTGTFWTAGRCSPMRSACCSTPTTLPIVSILGRRRLMKC